MYGVMLGAWIEVDGVQQSYNGAEEEGQSVIAFCDHADYDKLVKWCVEEEFKNKHHPKIIVDTDHDLVGAEVEENGIVVGVITDGEDEEIIFGFIVDDPQVPKLIQ